MPEPLPAGRRQRRATASPHHISAVAHLFFDEGAPGQNSTDSSERQLFTLASFGAGEHAAETWVALQTCAPTACRNRIEWRVLPTLNDALLGQMEQLAGCEAVAPAAWCPRQNRIASSALVVCLTSRELGRWATAARVGRLLRLLVPGRLEILVFPDGEGQGVSQIAGDQTTDAEGSVRLLRCQNLIRAVAATSLVTVTILPPAGGRPHRQEVLQRVTDRLTADFSVDPQL